MNALQALPSGAMTAIVVVAPDDGFCESNEAQIATVAYDRGEVVLRIAPLARRTDILTGSEPAYDGTVH